MTEFRIRTGARIRLLAGLAALMMTAGAAAAETETRTAVQGENTVSPETETRVTVQEEKAVPAETQTAAQGEGTVSAETTAPENAEGGTLPEETEAPLPTFGRLTVSPDTRVLEMGKVTFEKAGFDAFCDFLSLLPELEHVEMFASPVNAEQIAELERRFPGVTFDWTIQLANHQVRTDAEVFSTLHYDHEKRHTEEDFALLRYCPNLLALDIGHNEIGDLSFLYHLPKLRVLILSDDRISCDITPIGSLTDLLYLEMYKNKITDITPLTSLKRLRHLNLDFNLIQDLLPLKALTSLEHLWIGYANSSKLADPVDREVARELQEALPNTRVNATVKTNDGGGWLDFRDHKRVKAMFRMKEYMPLVCEMEAEEASKQLSDKRDNTESTN